MKDKKKRLCITYLDAIEMREHNKRLTIEKSIKDGHLITFTRIAKLGEDPESSMALNLVHKDKLKQSMLALSDDGLKTLYEAIGMYLTIDK